MGHWNSWLPRVRILTTAHVFACATLAPALGHDGEHVTGRFEPWQLGVAGAVALAAWALVGWIRRHRRRR